MGAAQLAAWEKIAAGWEILREGRVYRCADCDAGVALAADGHGKDYTYTADDFRAHIVLHLRNRHPDLDPDKPL